MSQPLRFTRRNPGSHDRARDPALGSIARPRAEIEAQLAEVVEELTQIDGWESFTDPDLRRSCAAFAAYYDGARKALEWALGRRLESPILAQPALNSDVLAQELRAARPSADEPQSEFQLAVWRTLRWVRDDGSSNEHLDEPSSR